MPDIFGLKFCLMVLNLLHVYSMYSKVSPAERKTTDATLRKTVLEKLYLLREERLIIIISEVTRPDTDIFKNLTSVCHA